MKLYDIFEEIRKKKIYGQGKDHIVYDFEKDPNKIIKTAWRHKRGTYRIDDPEGYDMTDMDPNHIRIFMKYPNLFPKVHKHTKQYAVIEKLDTKMVRQEEKVLYDLLNTFELDDLRYMGDRDTIQSLYWNITKRSGFMKKLLGRMAKTTQDVSLLVKYLNLFKVINGTLKRAVGGNIDVGGHNLGYDGEGNLKLLDF